MELERTDEVMKASADLVIDQATEATLGDFNIGVPVEPDLADFMGAFFDVAIDEDDI